MEERVREPRGRDREDRSRSRDGREEFAGEYSLVERVVHINRVAKVVKGGRNFSFNAIVVVGDGKGQVGVGLGKANEVTDAVNKGTEIAKRTMHEIPLRGVTLPHSIIGRYGAARVLLKPATPGTGVIAGGPVRAIMECLGVKDVLTKVLGTNNPHNVVKATMAGLNSCKDFRNVAAERGVPFRRLMEMD